MGTLLHNWKIFTLLLCPIHYKYNYKMVLNIVMHDCSSKIDTCKYYPVLENYGM